MVTAFCLICSIYEKKRSPKFLHLRNKAGFTFAADSLTGYSTWPYVGGIDRIKQSLQQVSAIPRHGAH
jgi:hypothetical protein